MYIYSAWPSILHVSGLSGFYIIHLREEHLFLFHLLHILLVPACSTSCYAKYYNYM